MFELFKSDKDFCEVSLKPWIITLACCCVIVLVWGIYQHEIEPEALMENLNQKISEGASVLTNFSTTHQSFQTPVPQQEQLPYQSPYSRSPGTKGGVIAGNSLHNLENAFKQAIVSVQPTVVNIKSTRINGKTNQNNPVESVGSGLIVSSEGHILTNYHVIKNAHDIFVSVYGMRQKTYNAWVCDHHEETDLTLLKLETDDLFTPAHLGNSDLVEAGDLVLAIGSPFGMDQTVTSGIVSGVRKTLVIDGVRYENMIQTDASINRGSSGGPLVNIEGEIIGINTAIYAPTGVFSGTAFAMPVNRLKRFLAAHNILPAEDFLLTGFTDSFSNIKGWLGVEIQSVDRTTALHLGLPYIGGVLINGVSQNSPASRKGIKRGDVILEIDGEEIIDIDSFESLITNKKPEETLRLLVFSGKQLKEFSVTLSQFPS